MKYETFEALMIVGIFAIGILGMLTFILL